MPEKVVIGKAELWLGDCLEVLPTLEVYDLVLTDPPYGIGESKKSTIRTNAAKPSEIWRLCRPTNYEKTEWDDSPVDYDSLQIIISKAHKSIIWGGNYYGLPASSKWLVWDKQNTGDFADCELAWTNLPGAVRIFRHMWNGMMRASEKDVKRIHPTQKPIKLMEWCLSHAPQAKNILDPFMGSGSAGIAAMNLGKTYTGIEKEPSYFYAACKRIEDAQRQGRLFE